MRPHIQKPTVHTVASVYSELKSLLDAFQPSLKPVTTLMMAPFRTTVLPFEIEGVIVSPIFFWRKNFTQ